MDKASTDISISDINKKIDNPNIGTNTSIADGDRRADDLSLGINIIDRNRRADYIVRNIAQKSGQARHRNKMTEKNNK